MTRKIGLRLCWVKAKKTSYVTGMWTPLGRGSSIVVRIDYIKNSGIQILDVPGSAARTLGTGLEYKIKTMLRLDGIA